jgi:nitronate monooxygenase
MEDRAELRTEPALTLLDTPLTRHAGIEVPLLCGAMYPCSNPELVAAVSEAGGMGIIQPISMVYVHGHEFKAGLALMRRITSKPIGMNVIVEKSVRAYEDRMKRWLDAAIDGGIRFAVTALGNPRWVVERMHSAGGVVYHDVTDRRWAEKAIEHQVDGLIAVNRRAGGHAGKLSAEELLHELGTLHLPIVAAGGIGDERGFVEAIEEILPAGEIVKRAAEAARTAPAAVEALV